MLYVSNCRARGRWSQPCNGQCKVNWLKVLNGTAQNAVSTAFVAPAPPPTHYDPTNCMADEVALQIPGIPGGFCSPRYTPCLI